MKIVQVSLKDLYQFLITECRYGYSRNNHLMPDGAYDHVKTYLPFMKSVDADMAINTAKQLCEECISEELSQFEDGIDDEFGSRQSAFKFIEWLLMFVNNDGDTSDDGVGVTSDTYWVPYNIQNFKDNIAKDDEPRYDVYEAEYLDNFTQLTSEAFKLGKKVNEKMLSKNELLEFIFNNLDQPAELITYRKQEHKPDYTEHFETREDYNKEIMTKYVFDDIKKAVIVKRGDC